MNNVVNIQTAKDRIWTDEAGGSVQYARTTKLERQMEKASAKILKKSLDINNRMKVFKKELIDICENLHLDFMASKGIDKPSKGNFTWYNFDRTIKIEISVNERIEFDDLGIKSAKQKFDEFFEANITSEQEIIKQMVMDAFNTKGGRLDTKKVMTLVRYKDRVKSELFKSAVEDVENAIRRPESKTYFRVWQMVEDGSYESVDLNFSSIKA